MLLSANLEPAILHRVDVGHTLLNNVLPFLDSQGVILLLQTGVNCWQAEGAPGQCVLKDFPDLSAYRATTFLRSLVVGDPGVDDLELVSHLEPLEEHLGDR